ncbi:hypothetical protein FRB90_008969 [Tulasnella sp. 427]|nr:hypothetical protein FRB90_008969 [Tulasnella sp. 427]
MPLPRVPSEDAPYPSRDPTDLQKHVAAFDRDGDGLITVEDTCWGLNKLGVPWVAAITGGIIVHLFSSYPSQRNWTPDPWFRIRIAGIHRVMHASDSHTWKRRGILDLGSFDNLMYGDPIEGTMTLGQVLTLWKNNHDMHDILGAIFNLGEWFVTWSALKNKDGKIKKEDLRDLFTGAYFHKVFDNPAAAKKNT